jgi:hypothetical protein
MSVEENEPYLESEYNDQTGFPRKNKFRAIGTTASELLHFTLHFVEMWLAMLFGMALFGHARSGLSAIGYRGFLDTNSIQTEVGHGICMTIPMVLWMRIRGYRWRVNFEMALGMVAPWAVLLLLNTFGLAKGVTWLSERNAMAAGMLAVMIYHWMTKQLKW